MHFQLFIATILCSAGHTFAWSGILMDGGGHQQTQLYLPTMSPHAMTVSFGLPSLQLEIGVMFNGKAYIIGGGPIGNNFTNVVTVFDPMTNKTSSAGKLNYGRAYGQAAVVNNTIILCGGPDHSPFPTVPCEQYSPTTNAWTVLETPSAVYNMDAAGATLNNQFYMFGGF
jgi:hypothetical protein